MYLSLERRGGAVQSQVGVAMVIKKYLQDVQHAGHLSEEEDSMGVHLQVMEKSV